MSLKQKNILVYRNLYAEFSKYPLQRYHAGRAKINDVPHLDSQFASIPQFSLADFDFLSRLRIHYFPNNTMQFELIAYTPVYQYYLTFLALIHEIWCGFGEEK